MAPRASKCNRTGKASDGTASDSRGTRADLPLKASSGSNLPTASQRRGETSIASVAELSTWASMSVPLNVGASERTCLLSPTIPACNGACAPAACVPAKPWVTSHKPDIGFDTWRLTTSNTAATSGRAAQPRPQGARPAPKETVPTTFGGSALLRVLLCLLSEYARASLSDSKGPPTHPLRKMGTSPGCQRIV
eukprot:scaffold123610_cov25-Tisochrysis_lutea.AAC.1